MGFLPRELLSVSCIFTIRTVHRSPFGHLIPIQSLDHLHPQMSGVRQCTAHEDLYKISIAFTIRSVDHSLSTRLITAFSRCTDTMKRDANGAAI